MSILLIPVVDEGDKRLLHGRVWLRVVGGLRFQVIRRAVGNQLAAIDQPDTVAILRLVHKVGGDHHGHAFFHHAIDMQPEFTAGEGIHA